ncbi:copper resistance protein NlpE [Sphingobacterium sp. HJSM2_6]|uniref:copper resistance protein NlpE n=1 Tax=Sphingobacterium sp. HJSM2_6 TaxID=3366264 RepID=UPI003BCB883E
MKNSIILMAMLLTWSMTSCVSNSNKPGAEHQHSPTDSTSIATGDNSQTSLDWAGTYTGVLPCADCPGIETSITLNDNETFHYKAAYQERDTNLEDHGKFMWHDNGSIVHLMGKEVNMKLKVGENQLFSLDQDGKIIEGPLKESFILKKIQQP